MLMRALTIVLVTGLLPVTTFVSSASAQDFSADSIYQLQQLQDEVRQLRGLVEQQQRELDRLRERQRDQYLDLDTRIPSLGVFHSATMPAVVTRTWTLMPRVRRSTLAPLLVLKPTACPVWIAPL